MLWIQTVNFALSEKESQSTGYMYVQIVTAPDL